MAGVKPLRKIQLGREGTAGTEANATSIWRGTGGLKDETQVVFPEENVGLLSGTNRAYIPKVGGVLAMDSTPATFEQILHILEAGVLTATPAQDGTGSGYVYAYPLPTTSAPTIKTYTLEGGDNQQEEQMLYGYVEDFTLAGKAGEALTMAANWRGRQVATGSFTAALSVPTVEEILFSKGKLYIDAAGGTIGSTQKTATLLSATLAVKTGLMAVYTADGSLYFTFVKSVAPEVTLNITFEHDSTSVAEKAAWRAGTGRLVRLLFEGSSLGTPGTTYSKKTLIIDLAGKYETFDALGDQDGNDIVTATFRARYSSTDSLFAEIKVVNELTTVP